jgi:hypothetical protein
MKDLHNKDNTDALMIESVSLIPPLPKNGDFIYMTPSKHCVLLCFGKDFMADWENDSVTQEPILRFGTVSLKDSDIA